MNKEQLKSCPFCGKKPTSQINIIGGITRARDCIRFSICCTACHIKQYADIENNDSFETIQKAVDKVIEAWNRRVDNGGS